jgi:hypothetical protein
MTGAIPEPLANYFEQRQAARAKRVNDFLTALTPRERALVEQAAAMGYVRGTMAPKDAEIPLNKEILHEVVDACFVFPDLYPVFHADLAPHPASSTWKVESPRRGEWKDWGATYDDLAWASERYANAIEHAPTRKVRLVRADTVYTVVAEHDPDEEE